MNQKLRDGVAKSIMDWNPHLDHNAADGMAFAVLRDFENAGYVIVPKTEWESMCEKAWRYSLWRYDLFS